MGEPARKTAVEIAQTIGRRVAELRADRGLTLQQVADRAGMAKSYVWEIEQGRAKNPTIDSAISLSAALGVSLDYLTGLTNSQPVLHPEALRIACEVDALIRRTTAPSPTSPGAPDAE